MSRQMLASLRAHLRDDNSTGGFITLFGNRVYLDEAPADTPLPLCVYELQTERFESMMRGTDHVARAVFRMACSADTNLPLYEAQERLKSLLDGTVLQASGYDRVLVTLRRFGSPVRDDDAWTLEDEYELRGNHQ
jgi:hypothetical protein